MKKPGGRPPTQSIFYVLQDPIKIAVELFICMVRRHYWHVLSVITEIEHQQIESLQKMLPVGIVRVGSKAIAMAEQKPNPVRIAVAPHANFRAVLERNVKDHTGGGKFEMHVAC